MLHRPRVGHALTVTALLVCAVWSPSATALRRDPPEPSNTEPSAASRPTDKKATKAEQRAERKRERAQAKKPSTAANVKAATDETRAGQPATDPGAAAQPSVAENPIGIDAAALPAPAADEALEPSDFQSEPLDAETDEQADAIPGEEPSALLTDSLGAYESALTLWEQGMVEDAFAALDRAYTLMAAVDIEGEPLRAQEKEDLRRLISRRVVEIYASRATVAGDLVGSIPIEINEHVEREIQSFSGPERKFFLEAYARSGQYRPMMLEELRSSGMPLELAWMPLVESGFKVRAYSVARALGLWQFIASTGYRFGVGRYNWFDERVVPTVGARAAIAYLTELHSLFGDWLTALAAYNCGEHLVLRLLSSQPVSYFDRFWDLYPRLPRETRRYVPRFLAVVAILEDPTAYGFEIPETAPPLDFDIVHTERTADLGELERKLQLADGTIKGLNPELRRNATPAGPYDVKVPKGTVEEVVAAIAQLPSRVVTADAAPSASGTHRVRPGETLSRVAARYGTTIDALVAWNGLQSADRIWPGQSLRVRSAGGTSSGAVAAASRSGGGATKTHRVRRGDNLWLIAQRYGTTVDRIKSDNGLRSNLLQVGQKLVVRSSGAAAGGG